MLTENEEKILRLMIDELRTRKKLDAERRVISQEIKALYNEAATQINSDHSAALSALQADFDNAERGIIDEFK